MYGSFVENTSGDDLEFNSEYMHNDIIVEVNLHETFLYPLFAYDIVNDRIEGTYICEGCTFGESEDCLEPGSCLLLTFNPGCLLKCGDFIHPTWFWV